MSSCFIHPSERGEKAQHHTSHVIDRILPSTGRDTVTACTKFMQTKWLWCHGHVMCTTSGRDLPVTLSPCVGPELPASCFCSTVTPEIAHASPQDREGGSL
jgi:hypothetical protein